MKYGKQTIERQYKDLMLLTSRVRIPLWDMGTSPSVETEYKTRSRIVAGVTRKKKNKTLHC
jgi:hypothetical protein